MENIFVKTGTTPASQIYNCPDADPVPALDAILAGYDRVYAVADSLAAEKCPGAGKIVEHLSSKGCPVFGINALEAEKSMDTVLAIASFLMEQGADRDALVLAIGGGITTDMTGFAASIYKRGVRFAFFPTTLLSQVDAAIGGKTGVNFLNYKNMLGVIRQPEFTFLSPSVLLSLPKEDLLCGCAEMLKTFIIQDDGNYQKAVSLFSALHQGAHLSYLLSEMSALVGASARVKAGVVSRDQFEKGERRNLNLGHTFAHAMESLAMENNIHLPHGLAVGIGTVLAAKCADSLGLSDGSLERRLRSDFNACGLPVDCPFPLENLAPAMYKDKKAAGKKVHFILPERIGKVVVRDMTPEEAVELIG